jgi:hypothetical protein
MKYTRYYLRCRYKFYGKKQDECIWIFKSKKIAESVLNLMKQDEGYLSECLSITKFTRDIE